MRKLNDHEGKLSTALGIMGMPGLTAYAGLMDMGNQKRVMYSLSQRQVVQLDAWLVKLHRSMG